MTASTPFTPFADESSVLSIGEWTAENRTDRISLYGSLELTRDQAGLAKARQLQSLLNAVVAQLEAADLPEAISVKAVETVANPFN